MCEVIFNLAYCFSGRCRLKNKFTETQKNSSAELICNFPSYSLFFFGGGWGGVCGGLLSYFECANSKGSVQTVCGCEDFFELAFP